MELHGGAVQQFALFKIVILLMAFFSGVKAHAQDTSGGYFGFSYGLSVPDLDNTGDHKLWGIVGGSRISDRVRLGGYHLMASSEDGPGGEDLSFSLTGVEGRLNITTGEKEVFVSMRAGVSKIRTKNGTNDIVYSPYHWGFATGYNYRIYKLIQIGIEGSFLAVDPSSTTSSGTRLDLDPFYIMSFLGLIGLSF